MHNRGPNLLIVYYQLRKMFTIFFVSYSIHFYQEFWKITLMGTPEAIGIFEFTMVLITLKDPFQIFQ